MYEHFAASSNPSWVRGSSDAGLHFKTSDFATESSAGTFKHGLGHQELPLRIMSHISSHMCRILSHYGVTLLRPVEVMKHLGSA